MLTAASLAMTLMVALLYPQPLTFAVYSTVAGLSALATAAAAMLLGQRVFADRLNLWDKSMLMAFASLAAGGLVDHEAVRAVLESNVPGAAESPAPANTTSL
jgi:hypothetical protein